MKRTPVAVAMTLALSGGTLAIQSAGASVIGVPAADVATQFVDGGPIVNRHVAIKQAIDGAESGRILVAQMSDRIQQPSSQQDRAQRSGQDRTQQQTERSAGQQGDGGMATRQQQAGQKQALNPQLVMKVQKELNAKGYDAGPVDGKWGPLTQRGVKNFQESQGNLKATGRIDAQTLAALGIEGSAADGGDMGMQKDKAKKQGQSGQGNGGASTMDKEKEQTKSKESGADGGSSSMGGGAQSGAASGMSGSQSGMGGKQPSTSNGGSGAQDSATKGSAGAGSSDYGKKESK